MRFVCLPRQRTKHPGVSGPWLLPSALLCSLLLGWLLAAKTAAAQETDAGPAVESVKAPTTEDEEPRAVEAEEEVPTPEVESDVEVPDPSSEPDPPLPVVDVQPYEPVAVAPSQAQPEPVFNPTRVASVRRSFDSIQATAPVLERSAASLKRFAERDARELAAAGPAASARPTQASLSANIAGEDDGEAEQDVLALRRSSVRSTRRAHQTEDESWGWLWALAAIAGGLLVPIGVLLARPTRNS